MTTVTENMQLVICEPTELRQQYLLFSLPTKTLNIPHIEKLSIGVH
jgi:hypothetical protein